MNIQLKFALLLLFSLGMLASVAAQNKPNKASRSSSVHHAQIRDRSSGVVVPDESKKLNSDLAKLESQTSKGMRPARSTAGTKRVLPTKTVNKQERNPPINFTYNGNNGGSHNGGASRTTSAPPKASPRIR